MAREAKASHDPVVPTVETVRDAHDRRLRDDASDRVGIEASEVRMAGPRRRSAVEACDRGNPANLLAIEAR
jgi:hypothetical protein